MTEDTTPHANRQPVAGRALNDQLGQTVAKLRERGNAMRCHPAANGTISHTEAAGELLCDVASLIEKLAAERDGLMQTLRDEMDENLRLRELGGALPDENITAMTERLIRERCALRAQLAIAARGLKHCAGWNINDDKRNALMAVVLESETMLAHGPNVEFSGVPAGHSSNHPAGGTSAGTQG